MTDTDERIQPALERLRGDETLTADLDDSSAAAVLQWLESELRQGAALDERTFEERVAGLRRAVKQAARRYDGDLPALLAEIKRIAASSPTVMLSPPAAPVNQALTPRPADPPSRLRRLSYLRRELTRIPWRRRGWRS